MADFIKRIVYKPAETNLVNMSDKKCEYFCISCQTPAKALFKRTDGNFIKLLDCVRYEKYTVYD